MSNTDTSTGQFSSSNWYFDNATRSGFCTDWACREVYKDAFAPQSTVQKPKGWERAPVSAHAPRLQGQKIWKRAGTRSQRRNSRGAEDDAQLELERGGAGARKKSKIMGAKENINSAPWLEAQDDRENTGPTVALGKHTSLNTDPILEDHDALRFVPRKRTNINHVITPRKALRQTTLNAQAQTLSPRKSSIKAAGISPRKRKSMRQSTRRLTRSELAEFEAPVERQFSDIIIAETPVPESLDSEKEIKAPAESAASNGINVPAIDEDPTESNVSASTIPDNILPVTPVLATSQQLNQAEDRKTVVEEVLIVETAVSASNSDIIAETTESSNIPEDHDGSQALAETTKTSRRRETLEDTICGKQEIIQPLTTPRSTRKAALGTPGRSLASATKQAMKSGSKTLRRSTRNSRASSVGVEAPAPATELAAEAITNENSPTADANMAAEVPSTTAEESPDKEEVLGDMIPVLVTEGEGQLLDTVVEQSEITPVKAGIDQIATKSTEGPVSNEDTEVFTKPDAESIGREEQTVIITEDDPQQEVESVALPVDYQDDTEESDTPKSPSLAAEAQVFEFVGSPGSDIPSESSLINFSPEITHTLQFDMSENVETLKPESEDITVSQEQVIELNESVDEIVETSTPYPNTTDLTETISANAPVVAYDEDDTDMLRNFLTRVKANKAAKAEKSPPMRKRSLPHSPLRLPLGTTEGHSSPPPTEVPETVEHEKSSSPLAKRRKRGDIAMEDEDAIESRSIRRSGRTRLPVKSQPPGAPSFIPVRRMGQDGDTTVTLKRSEEKELAALTRVNTRKNKGAAISASAFLAKKTDEKEDPVLRQRSLKEAFEEKAGKKKAKTVVWAEELAQYQKTEQELLKEKNEAIAEKKKSASVKVGIRSKIALGMGVNGTPASKRKMKSRG
ncbi:hypothetical protein BP5796_08972 [Coleophoma crateriformis]|uniref:Uncharacterized protein n=1 Tax=Coleophoma crateriformis TaxID=565419 RepID=A0A3D8R2N2_9HELO|nr:hypothetical protein BP5796_08972 [Coleophoma crateriformis]